MADPTDSSNDKITVDEFIAASVEIAKNIVRAGYESEAPPAMTAHAAMIASAILAKSIGMSEQDYMTDCKAVWENYKVNPFPGTIGQA
jgi:hypothetical protein